MEFDIFSLKGYERSYLKRIAHSLDPIVMIGQAGLTPGVIDAFDHALKHHELVKVRFQDYKEDRKILFQEACQKVSAQFVGLIGNIGIAFRHNYDLEQRIRLPKRQEI
jgi:RNA-binding protein